MASSDAEQRKPKRVLDVRAMVFTTLAALIFLVGIAALLIFHDRGEQWVSTARLTDRFKAAVPADHPLVSGDYNYHDTKLYQSETYTVWHRIIADIANVPTSQSPDTYAGVFVEYDGRMHFAAQDGLLAPVYPQVINTLGDRRWFLVTYSMQDPIELGAPLTDAVTVTVHDLSRDFPTVVLDHRFAPWDWDGRHTVLVSTRRNWYYELALLRDTKGDPSTADVEMRWRWDEKQERWLEAEDGPAPDAVTPEKAQ
jgi:hypothetical protein